MVLLTPVRRWIPNILTLLNLLLGSCGIVFLFNDHLLEALISAAACLLLDVADGLAARLLDVPSEMGKQLDSLADMVSFGVFPGCIAVYWWMSHCAGGFALAGLLLTVATALRLGKFNLDTREAGVFYGLPSPSAATAFFGILLMAYTNHPWLDFFPCANGAFIGLTVLLCLLMLSDLRLWNIKGIRQPGGVWILTGLLAALAVLLVFTGAAAVFLIIWVYVLFGVANLILKLY